MQTITVDQFRDICSGVWNDRQSIVEGRGFLSGDAALIRAVYWRLCKGGLFSIKTPESFSSAQSVLSYELVVKTVLEMNSRPPFNGAQYLEDLRKRYQTEFESTP